MDYGQSVIKDEKPALLEGFYEHYTIHIDSFDGPMDLLLHLIRKNELDIKNISISVITAQYLQYIKAMKELNLEIAGEFLVMAATLLQIKSKSLLPVQETDDESDEQEDPRTELIRRLLEYQQYKEAGQVIASRALLGREVFIRGATDPLISEMDEIETPLESNLFELVDAFRALLKRIPVAQFHDVAAAETFSIADCINEILSLLQGRQSLTFEEVVNEDRTRERIVTTFLALLELCRLKMIRIFQNSPGDGIWFLPAVTTDELEQPALL